MARHCALLAFCLIALVAPAVRGDLTQVQVEECSSGSTSNVDAVEIDFRAAHDSNTLRVRVLGAIGDMAPQPFPAFKTDACNFMGVSCPVKAGDKYTAKFDLAMSPTFPPVAGKAVFKGQDAAGEFFCFKVPVELKH
ncbi:hypothetical protein MTO96_005768 [Rhipicephalus appendiculatus]